MIYGINFNGQPIPPEVKRKFAQRVKVTCSSCGGLGFYRAQTADGEEEREGCERCAPPAKPQGKGYLWFELKGVAQSPAERDAMHIQASNGTRLIHVVPKPTAGDVWYGIYCY
jgi:hypothetical protein